MNNFSAARFSFFLPLFFLLFSQNLNAQVTWFLDADGDGYGNPNIGSFIQQPDYVQNFEDCDDSDSEINPETIWFADFDFDGFGAGDPFQVCNPGLGWARIEGDCNNFVAGINPFQFETCDGIDQNCDGRIDDGVQVFPFYRDADGDGFGNPDNSQFSCAAPPGFVANKLDCNDGFPTIRPGQAEICDGIDQNCNGQIDENTVYQDWFRDADGDGFGNISDVVFQCVPPTGYTSNSLDCNDLNQNIHPGASEILDGIDNNCDGKIDEIAPPGDWFLDADGDGFGNPKQKSATQQNGYVQNADDCNDANPNILNTLPPDSYFAMKSGGLIGHDEIQCENFSPKKMVSRLFPTNKVGAVQNANFFWVKNSVPDLASATKISGANSENLIADEISATTFFCRIAWHPQGCPGASKPSNWVKKEVVNCLRKGQVSEPMQIFSSKKLQIFPNPASDFLKILVPENFVGKSGKVLIFNAQGKFLLSQNVDEFQGEAMNFSLENFRNGMFWVELQGENLRSVRRGFSVIRE